MTLVSRFQNVSLSNRQIVIALSATAGSLAAIYLLYRWKQHGYIDGGSIRESQYTSIENLSTEGMTASQLKERGNTFFRSQRYDLALKVYQEALEKTEFDDFTLRAVLYSNMAAVRFNLGDLDGAINYASSSIEADPHYAKAYIRRAMVFEKRKNLFDFAVDTATGCVLSGTNDSTRQQIDAVILKLAVERIDQSYKTRPVPKICLYSIKRFMVDLFPDDIFTSDDLELVDNEFSSHDKRHLYVEAIKLFKQAQIGDCFEKCNAALDEVNLKELDCLLQRFLLLRMTCHFAVMNIEQTIADASTLLNVNELDIKFVVAAKLRLCALYLHSMDLENCINALNDMRHDYQDRAHTSYFFGQVYMLMMNFAMAKHCTKRAINLDPTNSRYQAQLLTIQANEVKSTGNMSSLSEVAEEMKALSQKHPEDIEIIVEHAQMLHDLQRVEECEQLMDYCIENADDTYTPHLLTQKAMQAMGRQFYDKAEALLDRAIQLDPYNDTAHQIAALVYYRRGDMKRTIEAFRKSADVARGHQGLVMSISMVITLEIQLAIIERLGVTTKASSTFSTYFTTFDSL